jgi:hypothetical protein
VDRGASYVAAYQVPTTLAQQGGTKRNTGGLVGSLFRWADFDAPIMLAHQKKIPISCAPNRFQARSPAPRFPNFFPNPVSTPPGRPTPPMPSGSGSRGRRRRPSAAAAEEEAAASPVVHVTSSSSGEDGASLSEEDDESEESGAEERARRGSARGQASTGKAEVEAPPAFLAAPSA